MFFNSSDLHGHICLDNSLSRCKNEKFYLYLFFCSLKVHNIRSAYYVHVARVQSKAVFLSGINFCCLSKAENKVRSIQREKKIVRAFKSPSLNFKTLLTS